MTTLQVNGLAKAMPRFAGAAGVGKTGLTGGEIEFVCHGKNAPVWVDGVGSNALLVREAKLNRLLFKSIFKLPRGRCARRLASCPT